MNEDNVSQSRKRPHEEISDNESTPSPCLSSDSGFSEPKEKIRGVVVQREGFFPGIADVTCYKEIVDWFPTQESLVTAMRRSYLLFEEMECPIPSCKANMSFCTKRSSQYTSRCCDKHESPVICDVTKGTVFFKSQVSLRKVFQILFLLSKGVSRAKISSTVVASLKTVDIWATRFRAACVKLVENFLSIGGTQLIVDLSLSKIPGINSDKSIALAGRDRQNGRFFIKVFQDPTEREIALEAYKNLFRYTEVFADFHRRCPSLQEYFPSFEGTKVNHLRGSEGKPKMDGLWMDLKNYMNDWSRKEAEDDVLPYVSAFVAIHNQKNLFSELLYPTFYLG